MPLLLELKSGDKIILNGAVIENSGANTKLLLHNRASVLRSKEVLTEEEAKTPAARVYLALQGAYIFSDAERHDGFMEDFRKNLADYLQACPSAQPIADDINGAIEAGNLYKGLKKTQKLVIHEYELLQTVEDEVKRVVEGMKESQGSDPEGDDLDGAAEDVVSDE